MTTRPIDYQGAFMAPTNTVLLDLTPTWPTGPVERSINRELDEQDTLNALREARQALARRRA
jgi:hypothetical protein